MAEIPSTAKAVELDKGGLLQASVLAGEEAEKVTILPGHEADYSACTFCLAREDHTLGNALRWIIMKDPDVEYCGYSAPHPSEDKIHLRIQMYDGLSAVECLRKALGNLRDLFTSIQEKYAESLRSDPYEKLKEPDVRKLVEKKVQEKRNAAGGPGAAAIAGSRTAEDTEME